MSNTKRRLRDLESRLYALEDDVGEVQDIRDGISKRIILSCNDVALETKKRIDNAVNRLSLRIESLESSRDTVSETICNILTRIEELERRPPYVLRDGFQRSKALVDILAHKDEPGTLGYHELCDPVLVEAAKAIGGKERQHQTLSHEVMEIAGDPYDAQKGFKCEYCRRVIGMHLKKTHACEAKRDAGEREAKRRHARNAR